MFRNDTAIFSFTGPMGIRVDVGQSLLMLLGILVYISMDASITHGLMLAGIIVVSILLHEYGHAWGCRVQGVPVLRIMLHGGGGYCQHAPSRSHAKDELIIAMGPIVNLALWAIAGILSWAMINRALSGSGGFSMPGDNFWFFQYYLTLFAQINLVLFVLNLVPVQPMDGGKLLHLFLLRILPPEQAHRTTGAVGLACSVLWIPAMIWVYVTFGWLLFYIPSITAHYRMMKGELGV